MSITLNEQQMNLLREYHERDEEYQAAKAVVEGTDFMDDDFTRFSNESARTYRNRELAATVFAASVAEGSFNHEIHETHERGASHE